MTGVNAIAAQRAPASRMGRDRPPHRAAPRRSEGSSASALPTRGQYEGMLASKFRVSVGGGACGLAADASVRCTLERCALTSSPD